MKKVVIAPSILGVPVNEVPNLVTELISKGADIIHFDVMDGKFVPNKSFSVEDFNYIKSHVSKDIIFDVHLMVCDVRNQIEEYLSHGADIVTFHYEAIDNEDIPSVLNMIHRVGKKAGISIKPDTDVKVLKPFLSSIDLVLIMSVEPGAGGQKFNEGMLTKVRVLDAYRKENNLDYVIEIDGGINDVTSHLASEAGVDYLVAGSYIVKSNDRKNAIASLR
jgi:ribulose-phosphate 3-epimerase